MKNQHVEGELHKTWSRRMYHLIIIIISEPSSDNVPFIVTHQQQNGTLAPLEPKNPRITQDTHRIQKSFNPPRNTSSSSFLYLYQIHLPPAAILGG